MRFLIALYPLIVSSFRNPAHQRRPITKPLIGYRLEHEGDTHRGMTLAYLTGDYTMRAIAAEFWVHYTTVSRAVKEYESRESR